MSTKFKTYTQAGYVVASLYHTETGFFKGDKAYKGSLHISPQGACSIRLPGVAKGLQAHSIDDGIAAIFAIVGGFSQSDLKGALQDEILGWIVSTAKNVCQLSP